MTKWVERYKVRSGTDGFKTYTVGVNEEGGFGCSCPGWIFHKENDCKHITLLRRFHTDLREAMSDTTEELFGALIVEGKQALLWEGCAVSRGEFVTGVNRKDWVFRGDDGMDGIALRKSVMDYALVFDIPPFSVENKLRVGIGKAKKVERVRYG